MRARLFLFFAALIALIALMGWLQATGEPWAYYIHGFLSGFSVCMFWWLYRETSEIISNAHDIPTVQGVVIEECDGDGEQ